MEVSQSVLTVVGPYYTAAARWVFVFLAVFILVKSIKSLLQAKNPSEIWAYIGGPDGSSTPLKHWENVIGRASSADIVVNLSSVSRNHGTLVRDAKGRWRYNDLHSKNGSYINGVRVKKSMPLKPGDILTLGGANFTLIPVSLQEKQENIKKRKRKSRPVSPWTSLIALTVFQLLTIVQFKVSYGEDCPASIPTAILGLCAVMWIYFILLRSFRRVAFEMETIAFFLSTLSIAATAVHTGGVIKQLICIIMGVVLFFLLCWFLRDLNRSKEIRMLILGVAVALMLANLLFGAAAGGATNWIKLGGMSVQPSELVKIAFIIAGSATLDELYEKKNLTVFMIFSAFCMGCLALMNDFGTAAIFFVTFLVIAFLRSGDFSRLILIVGGVALAGMLVLTLKPHVKARFAVWGHVWEDPTGSGYQQSRTMTAISSGGLPGVGAGNGWFHTTAASDTDLVFGLLAEEWGLIIAVLAVICIVTLGIFAVRSIIAGRSAYYSIAACAATSLFIFQTILNVFGSVDLLPLTGVTFPFVSSGGTSMIVSWGLLAFLKAADTRQNASFAVRLDDKAQGGAVA
ncbi:FtsW/RodA/SpoVE family cell cycle protein [bacterium 210820-DFI.6.37]|nr:FtsW/RodA/SpoVE family cell cycle protein [bacterium 210820-DFI.6.37]